MSDTSKQVWKSGMATEGNVLKLNLTMKLNPIEYTKTTKGVDKMVVINRLATLAGNNGFGSFILGKDENGNKIGIQIKVNRIDDNEQQVTGNSEFDMG